MKAEMAPGSAVSPLGVTELRHAADITARLRQAQRQVRGLLRMYEEGRSCLEVLDQLSAALAALRAIALLIIEDHVTGCCEPVASLSQDEERSTRLLTAIARVSRR